MSLLCKCLLSASSNKQAWGRLQNFASITITITTITTIPNQLHYYYDAIIIAKWPAANVHVAVIGISRQLTHVTRTTCKYSACLFYIRIAGNFCAFAY